METQHDIAGAVRRAAKTLAADDCYFPARKVWERYGVTDMSLHRWLHDERMNFPQPTYFGRLRFWKLSELEAWERQQAAR